MGSIPHKLIILLLIYLKIFLLTQEVVGSIPTLHIYFLLYFSPNSLIHSRGCGFNPHSPHFISSFIFSPNSLIHSRGWGFKPHSPHLFSLLFFSLLSRLTERLWVQIPPLSFLYFRFRLRRNY